MTDSDKEYFQAIQSAYYAKIDATLTIMAAKLDTHIENEGNRDSDIKTIKDDVDTLKIESANHAYKRKWQYAFVIIAGIVIAAFSNIVKMGIIF